MRTLLLFILIVSVAIWLPRRRSLSQHAAARQLNRPGIRVELREDRQPQPQWSRLVFGDNSYDFVDRVSFNEVALTSADIRSLEVLGGISDIAFYGCPNTDAALESVGKMSSLEVLHIERAEITTEGVNHLKGLRTLLILRISDTPLNGVDLDFLRSLRQLSALSLRGRSVDDQVLRVASTCKELDFLGLRKANVTDAGLSVLRNLSELENLVILECDITGVGLGSLAELPDLVSLDLEGSAIDDNGLLQIRRIRTLESLRLYSTKVSGDAVNELKRDLPECRVLSDYDKRSQLEPVGQNLRLIVSVSTNCIL